jgi:hypothetical protein
MRWRGWLGAEHLWWNASGLGRTHRATSRAHGQATADPTVANGTDTQGVIRTDVMRSEWMRWALRPAGDCISAVAECSIIATCTLTGAVTRTE